MTTAIGAHDPMLALAELMLDNDNLRAALDDADLRAARAEEHAALDQQLHALHAAAHHVRAGALVEGAVAVAGAATSCIGVGLAGGASEKALSEGLAGVLRSGGGAVSQLAAPAGRFVGDAPRLDAEADAKQAEARRSDAEARAEEVRRQRDRLDDAFDRSLGAVGSALDSEAQGNLAIIANV